jgi:hypothetical protein
MVGTVVLPRYPVSTLRRLWIGQAETRSATPGRGQDAVPCLVNDADNGPDPGRDTRKTKGPITARPVGPLGVGESLATPGGRWATGRFPFPLNADFDRSGPQILSRDDARHGSPSARRSVSKIERPGNAYPTGVCACFKSAFGTLRLADGLPCQASSRDRKFSGQRVDFSGTASLSGKAVGCLLHSPYGSANISGAGSILPRVLTQETPAFACSRRFIRA